MGWVLNLGICFGFVCFFDLLFVLSTRASRACIRYRFYFWHGPKVAKGLGCICFLTLRQLEKPKCPKTRLFILLLPNEFW